MHSFSFLSEHQELAPLGSVFSREVLERLLRHPVVQDMFLYIASLEVGSEEFCRRMVAMRAFVYESDWLRPGDREVFLELAEALWAFLVRAGAYTGSLPLLPMGDRPSERQQELKRCLQAERGAIKKRHAAQHLAGLIRDGLVLDSGDARRQVAEVYPEFDTYTTWLAHKYPGLFHDAHVLARFFHQKSVDIVS